MSIIVKAIRYRSLDEAKSAIEAVGLELGQLLDDNGQEPAGLLSVVPEDRFGEENFVRLLDAKKGSLVEVVVGPYSGYGPPALEPDYMGFASEKLCYILRGCQLAVEISGCPLGATDIHHLEAMVMDQQHPLDRNDLARRLQLSNDWDFDELFDQIADGQLSANQIDRMIHQSIQ